MSPRPCPAGGGRRAYDFLRMADTAYSDEGLVAQADCIRKLVKRAREIAEVAPFLGWEEAPGCLSRHRLSAQVNEARD